MLSNSEYSRLLKPISEGKGALIAALSFQREKLGSVEVLGAVQQINVCSKVSLLFGEHDYVSEAIHLPWASGIEQAFELRTTGGCGNSLEDYKWFSSNVAVVSVSTFGSIQAKRPGQAVIRVVSVFDSANYDEVASGGIGSSIGNYVGSDNNVNGERKNNNVAAQSKLKNVSGGNISDNAKCELLHCSVDGVVAEGRIASTDSKAKVHHVPLGTSCWKVWVDRVFVEKVDLI